MALLTIPARADRTINFGFPVQDWNTSGGGTVSDRRCIFPWSQLPSHGYNGGYYISFSEEAPYSPSSPLEWLARSPYAVTSYWTEFSPTRLAQISHTMPSVAGSPESVSGTLSYPDDESFYGAVFSFHAVPAPGYYYEAANILIETAVAEISRVGREFSLSAICYQLCQHADLALAPEYFEWDFNGTRVFVEGGTVEAGWDSYIPYRADALTHTFEGNAHGPVRVRSKNQYGQVSKWCIVPFAPVASAVVTLDGNTLEIDASDSFDPDGTVSGYQFVIGYAKPEDQPEEYFWEPYEVEGENETYIVSSDPVVIANVDALDGYGFSDGDQVPVTMRVKDAQGWWSDTHVHYFTYEGDKIDSFINSLGDRYGAVNEGEGVRVAKFKRDSSTRIPLHFQPDAKNPSLYEDKETGDITLGYTQRSTGLFKNVLSTDSGRSFA